MPVNVAQSLDTTKDASQLIQNFCEAQYNGQLFVWEESKKLVKFSPKRIEEERKKDPEFNGRVLSLDSDPIYIVDSFEILSTKIEANYAESIVKYKRLARTEGSGAIDRKVIIDKNNDIVSFKLSYDGKQWWIIDPPTPRVSKSAMIAFYKKTISRYKKFINKPLTSASQKKQFVKHQETLDVLEKL